MLDIVTVGISTLEDWTLVKITSGWGCKVRHVNITGSGNGKLIKIEVGPSYSISRTGITRDDKVKVLYII